MIIRIFKCQVVIGIKVHILLGERNEDIIGFKQQINGHHQIAFHIKTNAEMTFPEFSNEVYGTIIRCCKPNYWLWII